MKGKTSIPVNLYFAIPFAVWVIVGGVLYTVAGSEVLFRFINTNHTATLDTAMYAITHLGEASVVIPLLLFPFVFSQFRNRQYFIAAIASNIVPMLVSQGLKSLFNAPRPLSVFRDAGWVHHPEHWPWLYERSFPSGHSEGAFALFCFLSLILPQGKRVWGLVFFIMALLVCYSRVYLAAHFFEDVYVGSIIGTVVCSGCYYIVRRRQQQG